VRKKKRERERERCIGKARMTNNLRKLEEARITIICGRGSSC
jgi:hypothetical protein